MVVPELKEEWKRELEKRKRKWKIAGLSERLIEKGGSRAEGWLDGLVAMWDYKRKPSLAIAWQRENIPLALEHTERYMVNILRAFDPVKAGIVEKKLEEIV